MSYIIKVIYFCLIFLLNFPLIAQENLKVPYYYGENMVFQKASKITIQGSANYPNEVEVFFNQIKLISKVKKDKSWMVRFKNLPSGGPYSLKIHLKNSKDTFQINHVFIGELWLASGQSNMQFPIRDLLNSKYVLSDSINPHIKLFNLQPRILKTKPYTKEEMAWVNQKNFFQTSRWEESSVQSIQNFSAIAYSFAYYLQKKLNCPIGIIHNSVGGSPTESWISENNLLSNSKTKNLLFNYQKNKGVHPWIKERIGENLEGWPLDSFHPYKPGYLFETGISPFKDLNIKGVIWYQGESNAENISFHEVLFKSLISDWRRFFQKKYLPFYFVQLSSINRESWGEFRDSQRKLNKIPYTGMAVSLDLGHPSDVHPKDKWPIGFRLSNIALKHSYHLKEIHDGGHYMNYQIKGSRIILKFDNLDFLQTSDNLPVKDIYIAAKDHIFYTANAKIIQNKMIIWSEKVCHPNYFTYGYNPFSNGNLIDNHQFPISTFSNLIK